MGQHWANYGVHQEAKRVSTYWVIVRTTVVLTECLPGGLKAIRVLASGLSGGLLRGDPGVCQKTVKLKTRASTCRLPGATWGQLRVILRVTWGLPGVNFTNTLQAAFSYESFLCSFYVLTIWVYNFLSKGFWRKSCS